MDSPAVEEVEADDEGEERETHVVEEVELGQTAEEEGRSEG